MFEPLTRAACFPLKVFQSVEVRYPLALVDAAAILITGFCPPLEATGEVAVTPRTPVLEIDEPVDLTGATIDAQIVRRQLSNVKDTRYGLSFDISNYTPTPTPIPLTITNRDDDLGKFTLVIDDNSWGLVDTDAQLAINSIDGAGFSGRIKISFPQVPASGQPAEDNIIFLLFLVRSDGIVKV
jgi:hypothetical protein